MGIFALEHFYDARSIKVARGFARRNEDAHRFSLAGWTALPIDWRVIVDQAKAVFSYSGRMSAHSPDQSRVWFRDIRKLALLYFVAGGLGVLQLGWTAARRMLAVGDTKPQWMPWLVLALIFTISMTAVMPLFYFALVRNRAEIPVPKRLNRLALAGAIALVIVTAANLPAIKRSMQAYFSFLRYETLVQGSSLVSTMVHEPSTIAQCSTMLSEISNISAILLLIALSRPSGVAPTPASESTKFLRKVSQMTFIFWGLSVAWSAIRITLLPTTYYQLRDYTLQNGQSPPSLAALAVGPVQDLLTAFGLFAAPAVVYLSIRRTSKTCAEV